MATGLEDLFCARCGSYVHSFLDRCPACGTARTSLFEAAVAGEDIAPSIVSEEVIAAAGIAMRRNMLTSRGRGVGSTALPVDAGYGLDLADLFNQIASVIKYRVTGPGRDSPRDVRLRVDGDGLRLEDMKTAANVRALSLDHVLSTIAVARAGRRLPGWAGVSLADGAVALGRLPDVVGDLVVIHVGPQAPSAIGIGNRSGLFASIARPDHYEELARWLGVAAAVAAGRRVAEVGAVAYASELGLRTPADRPTGRRGDTPTVEPRLPRNSTAAALRDLEELRAGGLVTDDEYARKRREILDRL